jgi:NDP-sugar pyrophosphorylase family protein
VRALVLSAGLGTRLGDLTRELPKPLLPIGGEPLLGHTLRYLAAHGFDEVAINLHFRPDLVRDYVGDGGRFGVRVTWSHEPTLLGTAGAVKRLEPFFAGEREFLVIYGDLLIDHDLGAMVRRHRDAGAAATLLLHQRPGSNSLVQMDGEGRITGFVERPTDEQRRASPFPWVNSGVQLLGRAVLDEIPAGAPCDLPRDVYVKLFARARIVGCELAGYRCAIDSPSRYAEAQAAFADGRYRRR